MTARSRTSSSGSLTARSTPTDRGAVPLCCRMRPRRVKPYTGIQRFHLPERVRPIEHGKHTGHGKLPGHRRSPGHRYPTDRRHSPKHRNQTGHRRSPQPECPWISASAPIYCRPRKYARIPLCLTFRPESAACRGCICMGTAPSHRNAEISAGRAGSWRTMRTTLRGTGYTDVIFPPITT